MKPSPPTEANVFVGRAMLIGPLASSLLASQSSLGCPPVARAPRRVYPRNPRRSVLHDGRIHRGAERRDGH